MIVQAVLKSQYQISRELQMGFVSKIAQVAIFEQVIFVLNAGKAAHPAPMQHQLVQFVLRNIIDLKKMAYAMIYVQMDFIIIRLDKFALLAIRFVNHAKEIHNLDCTSCVPPLWLYQNQCVKNCPVGYGNINAVCQQCTANCKECFGTAPNECAVCSPGYYFLKNQCYLIINFHKLLNYMYLSFTKLMKRNQELFEHNIIYQHNGKLSSPICVQSTKQYQSNYRISPHYCTTRQNISNNIRKIAHESQKVHEINRRISHDYSFRFYFIYNACRISTQWIS